MTLPDTPVNHRARALLDAIAERDDAHELEAVLVQQFTAKHQQRAPLPAHLEVLRGLRGNEVCRIEYGSEHEALLLLGGPDGEGLQYVSVTVEEAAPHRISRLSTEPAADDALLHPPQQLDDAGRRVIVEGVADALGNYVFADVGAAMQAKIRAELDAGHYAELTHGLPLARRLTSDLREVCDDVHLLIFYSPSLLPPPPAEEQPSAEQLEQMLGEAEADEWGVSVDTLDGNVGYLRVRMFYPIEFARERMAAVMSGFADKRALIVDLRETRGGDPATVAFMTSYLFDDTKVHLNDLYYRYTDELIEYWTDPEVPGVRFGGAKPVYVLTSGSTYSGGEEFANNLRELDRATLIGEVTGGGAHPVEASRVDDHTLAVIPVGRAINPISKTNWEVVGVTPHVEVPADEALDRALARLADD